MNIDAIPCPRCQKGSFKKRNGAYGLLGITYYPVFRASYPDGKDGELDLSGASPFQPSIDA